MVSFSRRALLRLGAGGALAAHAGCLSRLGHPRLSLTLLNFDEEFHRLHVELHRADRAEASQALAFEAEYELAARGEEVTAVRDDEVLHTRRYLVRAGVDGETRAHYHFYPDCTGRDQPEDRLYVEVRPSEDDPTAPPELTFDQNGCGGDAWSL